MQDSTEENFQSFLRIKEEIKLLEEKVEKMPRCSEQELYALKLTCLENLNEEHPHYNQSIRNAIKCLKEEKLMNHHFSGLFVKMEFFVRDNERQKTIEECDYLIQEFRKWKIKEMRDIIIQIDYQHKIIEDKKDFKEKIEQCLSNFREETYENSFNSCKNLLKNHLAFVLQHQEDTLKRDFLSKNDIYDIRSNFFIFDSNENWIGACLGSEAKIWREQFTSNFLKRVERRKIFIENALNTDIRSKLLKPSIEEVDLIQDNFGDCQINQSCKFIKAKIKSFIETLKFNIESKICILTDKECQGGIYEELKQLFSDFKEIKDYFPCKISVGVTNANFRRILTFLNENPKDYFQFKNKFMNIRNLVDLFYLLDLIANSQILNYWRINFYSPKKLTHENYSEIDKKLNQTQVEINFIFKGCIISKIDKNILIKNRDISFEDFIELWPFFSEIPSNRFPQEMIIIAKNTEIMSFIDSLTNSSYQIEIRFKVYSPKDLTRKDFKEIWNKMSSLSAKQQIQIDFVNENLSILNNKISITKTRISFEKFITIWNFLEEDQILQIQNYEITIDANNLDFLNFLDAIANSPISFDCKFIFLSQSSKDALIDFQKIWLKMNSLSNKRKIQTNVHISQRSLLKIVPDNLNELCVLFLICSIEFFISVLSFLKEISPTKFKFADKNSSFLLVFSVEEFNDFSLNFKTIANFPVNIRLDPKTDLSFDDYEYMWESIHSKSSKIVEFFSDFWNFRRETMIIDFVKMSKHVLVPNSDLVNFISSKKPTISFTNCDPSTFNSSFKFSLEAVNLEIRNVCWLKQPLIHVFSQFENLYELSLYISVCAKEGLIEEFINFMLSRSKNLKILKMRAIEEISINFAPGSLENLYAIEMDFPGYERDPAHYLEELPSEHYLVSLKILGNCKKSKENLNFLKKFQYLTKLTYEPHNDHKISKSALFRLRFVISSWNLKRNLFLIFRKEIIEEIIMKLDY